MKKISRLINKWVYTIHRILGTLLSLLFLVWFLSGIVMMYHRFPRVGEREKLAKYELLTADLPSIEEINDRLPKDQKISEIRLNRFLGQTQFYIRTDKERLILLADTADSLPLIDGARIRRVASLWCDAPIERIDTMYHLDQWIPFGNLKKEFPIYKFHFNDPARHQLYIGSTGGEVLQFSDRKGRIWAWLGAIPHWVYFSRLRQNQPLWRTSVAWASGIGCIMTLAGLWVAINVTWRSRKRKKPFSPYKKKWYQWHYMTGLIFGVFVLTFTFSGMMSLCDVPAWISKPQLKKRPLVEVRQGAPDPTRYALDYRQVLREYPGTRQLVWSNFRAHPYYTVMSNEGTVYVDAVDTLSAPLMLREEEVMEAVQAIHHTDEAVHIELISRFETYYRNRITSPGDYPLLPVWKLKVDDADKSCYYIHPETGVVRYVNTTSRWKYWMYTALHRMRVPGLNSSTFLRKSVLWILLLGGTVVSASGVVLGGRYIGRLCRRKKPKRS